MKATIILSALLLIVAVSCKKEKNNTITNPPNPNEEELITTFRITFTDSAGIAPQVVASFVDIDGPGGNAPSAFDTIRLLANKTYHASITLLNESVSPAEDITAEVQEEGVDHLFCFELTSGLHATITRADQDVNGLPIGLLNNWVTGTASTGTATIRLRHQPGVKNGDCAPGETDIELNFYTVIQ
jgi:hypothetical protein